MKMTSLFLSLFAGTAAAAQLAEVGAPAPTFSGKTDKGENFNLADRKGKWTILYFYPKDDTPGCTKQACAFRDSIETIRKQGAEVYGISKDDQASHKKFVEKYHLTFPLIADPNGKIIKSYGADGLLGFAKRWTFIIGPDLTVRWKQTNVDPAINANEVAEQLKKLQKS